MIAILCCLFGIFVGMATAGYMYVKECEKKEQQINEQKEINSDLRAENEDLNLEKIQLNSIILKIIKIVSSIDTPVNKIEKIKELVDTHKTNN